MCDDQTFRRVKHPANVARSDLPSTAAVATTNAGSAPSAATGTIEKDVWVPTPDGKADAVLFCPQGAEPKPAVIIWVDIMGLRPAFREMGRRLASQGYVVLVPNPFYRSASAADIVTAKCDFLSPEGRAKLFGFRQEMSDSGVDRDALAYLTFLDAQPQVDTSRKAGVHGYCMGGPFSIRTAAAVPTRIGAVGIFHANGLATKESSSPHLLIAGTDARYLVAVAQNDDEKDPEAKHVLRKTFDATGKQATVEVYPADHGWCVPGVHVYDAVAAEKAWTELGKLYGEALSAST